jgi:capsid protein
MRREEDASWLRELRGREAAALQRKRRLEAAARFLHEQARHARQRIELRKKISRPMGGGKKIRENGCRG